MTKLQEHQSNARAFIDNVIKTSKYTYERLMTYLELKIEDWDFEYAELCLINIFELTDEQLSRKNYLSALSTYGRELVRKYQRTLILSK